MAYGLQVFDAAGTLRLDVSNRLTRIAALLPATGTYTISAINTGSPYDQQDHYDFFQVPSSDLPSGITNDGTWAAVTNSADYLADLYFDASGNPYLYVWRSSYIAPELTVTITTQSITLFRY
jgi:hypothetical protein